MAAKRVAMIFSCSLRLRDARMSGCTLNVFMHALCVVTLRNMCACVKGEGGFVL